MPEKRLLHLLIIIAVLIIGFILGLFVGPPIIAQLVL